MSRNDCDIDDICNEVESGRDITASQARAYLQHFANIEVAAEREACAKYVEAARIAERATCASIARDYARALSKGTHPKAGSIEEIGERIAAAIEIPF